VPLPATDAGHQQKQLMQRAGAGCLQKGKRHAAKLAEEGLSMLQLAHSPRLQVTGQPGGSS
jgi:hypothetical protein